MLLRTKGENIQECDCCGNASAAHYTTYKSATNHGLPRTPQSAPQSQRHYDTISHFKPKEVHISLCQLSQRWVVHFPVCCFFSLHFFSLQAKQSKQSKTRPSSPLLFSLRFLLSRSTTRSAQQHAALNNTQRSPALLPPFLDTLHHHHHHHSHRQQLLIFLGGSLNKSCACML